MTDFFQALSEFKQKYSDRLVFEKLLSARPPRYAAYPSSVPPILIEALESRGIKNPYTHQAAAWEKISAGKNVVVITPTASGKTLCYNVPVLSKMLEDPAARALYLFPTKALSQDQLAELQTLLDHAAPNIKAFTFDGDTPADARQAIRAQGHIVVTNPDCSLKIDLPVRNWQRVL